MDSNSTVIVEANQPVEKKKSLKKIMMMFVSAFSLVFGFAFSASAAEVGDGITNIGTLVTSITGWMGTILSTIVSNPLLLMMLGITVVGAVIGLVWRLIRG